MWHSLGDACQKCQALNGNVYENQNVSQNTLWDSFYGDIWDLNADHTLAHPNCRCYIEVRTNVDFGAWGSLQDYHASVKVTVETIRRRGTTYKVLRGEGGRFVKWLG